MVQVGGQCTCKQYVTGRRCDRCLSGYHNIRQSDQDGCSETQPATTAAVDQKTSPTSNSLAVTTTSLHHWVPPTKLSPVTEASSTPWLMYATPAYVVFVIVIIATIVVICVKRRRQTRDSGKYFTSANISVVDDNLS